jgi:hypothetical protein
MGMIAQSAIAFIATLAFLLAAGVFGLWVNGLV